MPPARPLAYVQNQAGRRGVPTARSFDAWVRAALGAKPGKRRQVNVVLFRPREARALNRQYRRKDSATDVLSFRAEEPGNFGDVVIAAGVAARHARQAGHSLAVELKVLALHGLLHLLGYDHEHDDGRMARLERRLRRKGGLVEGLIERGEH